MKISHRLILFLFVLSNLLAAIPAMAAGTPDCKAPYKVVRGDALSKISRRCKLSLSALVMANPQIKQPNRIYIGDVIYFPRKPEPVDESNPTIVSRPEDDVLSPEVIEELGILANSQKRWIDVDLSSQTVSAYVGHTVAVTFLASTGTWRNPTVTGRFWIYQKAITDDMRGEDYYLRDVPYTMYFHKDYGIHGTYWHNNFGTPMSHGCVNLSIDDAKWLFYFAQVETLINVHY